MVSDSRACGMRWQRKKHFNIEWKFVVTVRSELILEISVLFAIFFQFYSFCSGDRVMKRLGKNFGSDKLLYMFEIRLQKWTKVGGNVEQIKPPTACYHKSKFYRGNCAMFYGVHLLLQIVPACFRQSLGVRRRKMLSKHLSKVHFCFDHTWAFKTSKGSTLLYNFRNFYHPTYSGISRYQL